MTWEEGTWAAWLYDLLQPKVMRVLVCDSRRNALLKEGNKSDKIDARKLADLLRTGMLRPVYHGEHGLRTLRELGRSYRTISQDLNRVMNRIKALYRGWSIPCAGTQVYAPRYREQWLQRMSKRGCAAGRAALSTVGWIAGVKTKLALGAIGGPGNIKPRNYSSDSLHRSDRAARLIALMQTPHRFRSKRQLWTYRGLGIGPATVRNTAMSAGTERSKNRNRFVVSIRITTTR